MTFEEFEIYWEEFQLQDLTAPTLSHESMKILFDATKSIIDKVDIDEDLKQALAEMDEEKLIELMEESGVVFEEEPDN